MLKFWLVAILPVLAQSFIVEPQDEIINSYKSARALLTPEQEEFLMELLAADDALIEAQTSRGIVDDILQALSGAGNSNIRVNIIGGSTQQQQQQPQNNAPAAASNPPVTLINPSFTLVSNPTPNQQQKALINGTDTSTPASAAPSGSSPSSIPASGAAPQSPSGTAPSPLFTPASPSFNNATSYQMTTSSAQSNTTTTTIGGSNNHLFSTISQVIMNSNRRNVTGIVDESLRIATPAPIREFVTGILQVVYCNGIRRLLGRC